MYGHHAGTIQPRVCGDYSSSVNLESLNRDTTPRMRGLPSGRRLRAWSLRYNPAYAGTTRLSTLKRLQRQIQPRVCGDYHVPPLSHAYHLDTTPRMRGLRSLILRWFVPARYNPAYAGTTPQRPRTFQFIRIQPRVCGDYSREYLTLAPF